MSGLDNEDPSAAGDSSPAGRIDPIVATAGGIFAAVSAFVGLLTAVEQFLGGAHARQAFGIGLVSVVLVAVAVILLGRRTRPRLVWKRGVVLLSVTAVLLVLGGVALAVVPPGSARSNPNPSPLPATHAASPDRSATETADPAGSTSAALPATSPPRSPTTTRPSAPTAPPTNQRSIPCVPTTVPSPPALPPVEPGCQTLLINVDQYNGTTTPIQIGHYANATGADPSVGTGRQLLVVVYQAEGYFPWVGQPARENGQFTVYGLQIGQSGDPVPSAEAVSRSIQGA